MCLLKRECARTSYCESCDVHRWSSSANHDSLRTQQNHISGHMATAQQCLPCYSFTYFLIKKNPKKNHTNMANCLNFIRKKKPFEAFDSNVIE